jgi:hypothetical protein
LEPTLITFMGKMPGMLAVVGGFFFVSVARIGIGYMLRLGAPRRDYW